MINDKTYIIVDTVTAEYNVNYNLSVTSIMTSIYVTINTKGPDRKARAYFFYSEQTNKHIAVSNRKLNLTLPHTTKQRVQMIGFTTGNVVYSEI